MRPPEGDIDDRVREIMKQLGYKIAMWNHDTFDWKSNSDPNFDLDWILSNFTVWASDTSETTGKITLEHDLFERSASQIPLAISIVVDSEEGYEAKQLSKCFVGDRPYIENVTFPDDDDDDIPTDTNINDDSISVANFLIPSKYLTRVMVTMILMYINIL